ncbi:PA domain-containing protein [Fluviicola sp.]|uniref:PA domain-containing protein n=1 Tax=Fluviicola sp. TaxID=1917219 RepID=UPI0031DC9744
MKKLLLSLGLVMVGSTAMSQVVFSVEEPASIQGFYDFTSNGDGTNWGLATLVGFSPILDTVVIPNDGTLGVNAQGNPASATGCNALAAGSLAGKVAMIYRGDGGNPGIGACGFGVKAKMCQDAGAVAVIIVNREEQLLNMNGGTTASEGPSVTIPVVFVKLSTGTLIKQRIDAMETVTVLIGDKTGYYNDDITTLATSSVRAQFGSKPVALTQSASEFSFSPGTWVYNFGQNNQNTVTLNTVITRSGTEVYNQTSSSVIIPSGDSVFMTTPTYSSSSYTVGLYEVSYNVSTGGTDQFPGDNISTNNFSISDSLWSLAGLDPTGDVLVKDGFYRPNTLPNNQFETCIAFKDANAHRVAVDGIYYGGFTIGNDDTATTTLDGVEFTWSLYSWSDQDQTTASGTFAQISEVAAGSYIYPDPADNMLEKTVFMPITSSPYYRLTNNQSYLLCITSYIPKAFMAYSTSDHYDYAMNQDDLIRFPIRNDGTTWVNAGFVGLPVPSIAVRTGATLNVAENTLEAAAFPIPAKEVITVKVKAAGDATLNIIDMAGRQVSTQNVKIENGQFQTSVEGLNSGTYIFTLDYSNGTTSRFNVVVSK